MKKNYISPAITIVKLDATAVICDSKDDGIDSLLFGGDNNDLCSEKRGRGSDWTDYEQ